ncbi:Allantoate amidohydrolase [compost metagenome]
MHAEPVPMDRQLLSELEAICSRKQIGCHPLYSGAGHDAQIMSAICPAAMLFVPSRAGISHSPLEHTDAADMAAGTEVLMELLYKLAYSEE